MDKNERDIKRLWDYARVIFLIENGKVERIVNPDWKVNIMAVIGRAEVGSIETLHAPLMEIGISDAVPYSRSKILGKRRQPGDPREIHTRSKKFEISKRQYQLVAPHVFLTMQDIVDEMVSNWKWGGPGQEILVPVIKWGCKGGRTVEINTRGYKGVQSGICFSVNWFKDSLLAADLCWAEAFVNKELRRRLTKTAKAFCARLRPYARDYPTRKPFVHCKGAEDLKILIENHSLWYFPHLLKDLIDIYVPRFLGKRAQLFQSDLSLMCGLDGSDFKIRILRSEALPGAQERLQKIQTRFTREGNHQFLVFEIYPSDRARQKGVKLL